VRAATSVVERIRGCLLGALPLATARDAHALVELVAVHGDEAVGRGHIEVWHRAPWTADWRRLAAALARLLDVDRTRELVLAEGTSPDEADHVAAVVRRQAGWMLLAALESRAQRPTIIPSPLRSSLLEVLAAPWPPLSLAVDTAEPLSAALVEEFRLTCQDREVARERATIAAEIRRVVAASGVSQRDFAARLGTSGSRLSTYLNGHVMPSAAIMLRIKRVGRELKARPPGGRSAS